MDQGCTLMKRKENHEEDQNYHKELHLYYAEVMIVLYAKTKKKKKTIYIILRIVKGNNARDHLFIQINNKFVLNVWRGANALVFF